MKSNSDFVDPLYDIGHVLKNKNTPLDDFKKIIEEFFSDYPKAYFIIANLFYNEEFYKTTLEYVEKCELAGIITEDLLLLKAKCLIMSGAFNECIDMDSIVAENSCYLYFSMYKVISNILTNNYDNALYLLSNFKIDDLSGYNKKLFKVYSQFLKLYAKEPSSIISEEENDEEFLIIILEICETLLINHKFDELEIAVNLLNLINNKFVRLTLGKLYHKYGYIELAKKEIMSSIKEFEVYDDEGLKILMKQVF